MFQMMSQSIMPLLQTMPRGYAHVRGSSKYPNIRGMVLFYSYAGGTVLVADIGGLPTRASNCRGNIFGFHIHENGMCNDNTTEAFVDAGGHYNPEGCMHPEHAGDMPVLFENNGNAWMSFYTDRFRPEEVRGRAVIIHDMPDDFSSDPSGNSGERIACGVIR